MALDNRPQFIHTEICAHCCNTDLLWEEQTRLSKHVMGDSRYLATHDGGGATQVPARQNSGNKQI